MYSLFYGASFILTLLLSAPLAGSGSDLILQMLEINANAQSYEQTSHVSFDVSYSGGDEHFQDAMRKVKNCAEAMEYTTYTALNGGTEEGRYSMYTESLMSLDPIQVRNSMWMSTDENDTNYELILKIPAMVKAVLPKDYAKDYLHIESAGLQKLANDEDEGRNMLGMINFANLFRTHGTRQQLLEMLKPLNLASHLRDNSTLRLTETGDGKTNLVLSITDAQFKSFVLSLMNEILENEQAANAMIDIAFEFMWTEQYNTTKTELHEDLIDSLSEALPKIKAYFAQNTILSNKGYLYEAVLNQDGYMENENTVIGLSISNDMIEPFTSGYYYYGDETVDKPTAAVDFTITFSVEYKNINGTVEIKYPVLDKNNSVNLADAIRKTLEEQREARKYDFPYGWYRYEKLNELEDTPVNFPLKGTFHGKTIDTDISLVYAGYDYYIPLSQAATILGGEVSWDAGAEVATWRNNGTDIAIVTSDIMYGIYDNYGMMNGYDDEDLYGMMDWYNDDDRNRDRELIERSKEINNKYSDYRVVHGKMINNMTFIQINHLERYTDADFGFDDKTGTVLIRD